MKKKSCLKELQDKSSTSPGRLVYRFRVVDAYHVILDPREGTLIFLTHSLVFTPLPSSLTLDLFDQRNLD
jgi:hypothetical protein